MTKLIKFKEKIKLSSEAKMILTEIIVFVLGFVLMGTKFMFGIYPFGIAYLCSLRKYTPFGFCGCILSVIFTMNCNIAYLVALLFILGLRIAGSLIGKKDKHIISLGEKVKSDTLDNIFCENIEVRVSISVLGALGIGIYSIIASSYAYYEIFALIFFMALVGILTYALSIGKRDKLLLGYGVIVFALIYALRDFTVFSLDVSVILGYSIVLYLSKYLGAVKSGAYGLILGLCVSPVLAPVFSIGAIVSGLLWGVSYYLAILCAAVLSVGYSVFVGGYSALITVTPSVLFVSLLIYPLLKFKMIPVPDFIRDNTLTVKSIDTVILEKTAERNKNHLSNITKSFSQIASLITDAQEKEKTPSRVNLHTLCISECENYCYSCPKNFICWQNDVKETDENLNRLSLDLFSNGSVSKMTVTEKFLHRCPNIDQIINSINQATKKRFESTVKNNKLEIASKDYEQIARLLENAREFNKKEEISDTRLSESLCRMLAKIGLIFEDARVFGKENREIIITGINIERSKCTKDQLKNQLEELLNATVGDIEIYEDGGIWNASVSINNIYTAKSYVKSIPKSGETENGDSFVSFEGAGNKKYAIICDGMGSGSEASSVSYTCVSFLKEILKITSDAEVSLNMLSSLLRARGLECSSTVDILKIDLNTGKGSVIKCGASPTYIKRGDKVFKLQSQTMPLGILKDLDAEESSFELMTGDACIMVSDGVADSKNDERIMKIIRDFNGNIDTLPEKIINEVKKSAGASDDMTVLVTEITAI